MQIAYPYPYRYLWLWLWLWPSLPLTRRLWLNAATAHTLRRLWGHIFIIGDIVQWHGYAASQDVDQYPDHAMALSG